MGGEKHVAALAEWQLEKWREYMRTEFRLAMGYKPTPVLICAWCDMTIIRLTDDNEIQYSWEFGQLEALSIAHLRNNHRDVEDKVYG